MTFDLPLAPSYSSQSQDIRVTVFPIYLDSQSAPDENHYLWAYHVRIENMGTAPVQLKNRHWEITDSFGRTQIINGAGVVGEQPLIQPGENYEYTSGTPLTTPSGIMVGHYSMSRHDGEMFSVDVPAFSLDSPYQPIILN